jgi:hypothetical protein
LKQKEMPFCTLSSICAECRKNLATTATYTILLEKKALKMILKLSRDYNFLSPHHSQLIKRAQLQYKADAPPAGRKKI